MLTAKQEKFVQGIIQGKTQADAYREAYTCNNMTDKTIHECASKLVKEPKISTRIEELRKQIASSSIMSAQERLEWLTEVVRAKDESMNDRLRAADIMNKMTGQYVTRVEAEVAVERLEDLI